MDASEVLKLAIRGARVRLKSGSVEEFGVYIPEEDATLCGPPSAGMLTAYVDEEYCTGPDDDGLREFHWKQIKEFI